MPSEVSAVGPQTIPVPTGGANSKLRLKFCTHNSCGKPCHDGSRLCPMHQHRRRSGKDMDAPARTQRSSAPLATQPDHKVCIGCLVEKPMSSFRERKRRGKSVLVAECRACELRAKREHDARARRGCNVNGCKRIAKVRGMCKHHATKRATGVPDDVFVRGDAWGSGHITKNGYRWVSVAGKQRPEHRVIMERHIGRRLLDHENVHHINGVRDDNRVENLEIWSTSQPSGQRIPDKVAHARETLGLYAPGALTEDWNAWSFY